MHKLLTLLLCFVMSSVAWGQKPVDRIRSSIDRHQATGQLYVAGAEIASSDVFWLLYENNGYRPLWTDPERIADLIDLVGRAEEEGLLPRDYHSETLKRLRSERSANLGDLDLLLTDSLIRYLYHQDFGKVDPSSLDSNWNLTRKLGDLDPGQFVLGAIQSDGIRPYISSVLRRGPYYRMLKELLAEYRARAAREGGGYAAVPAGPTLRRGMRDARVPLLRERLEASGHLTASTDDDQLFDRELERAVMRFQSEAGIDVDGAVGAGTLAALNVSLQSRIDQIRVNMERVRWVFRDLRDIDDYVLVNIADFKTMLYRDQQLVWETKAQVGRTYRKSPIFRADMKYVQFNPTWTVPPGILRRDILPKIKADPGYLASKNMKLVSLETGQEIAPDSIDWSTQKRFPYQVVQRPGPENALGQVKFIFPNPHFVFLHDTPHKEHFDDQVRTFSSGCIRIQDPFIFAEKVLQDPDWNQASIAALVDTAETKTVYLDRPLPVLILYWTVVPDAKPSPRFLPDVYDRDDAILKALNAEFQLVLPDDLPAWLNASHR